MFEVVQTEYTVTYAGYIYYIFERKEGISIYRRKESHPNVPACKEVYTRLGWKMVINLEVKPLLFNSLKKVRNFIKAQDLTNEQIANGVTPEKVMNNNLQVKQSHIFVEVVCKDKECSINILSDLYSCSENNLIENKSFGPYKHGDEVLLEIIGKDFTYPSFHTKSCSKRYQIQKDKLFGPGDLVLA